MENLFIFWGCVVSAAVETNLAEMLTLLFPPQFEIGMIWNHSLKIPNLRGKEESALMQYLIGLILSMAS